MIGSIIVVRMMIKTIEMIKMMIMMISLSSATDPERGTEASKVLLPAEPACLVYHCGQVWVGLSNGCLLNTSPSPRDY